MLQAKLEHANKLLASQLLSPAGTGQQDEVMMRTGSVGVKLLDAPHQKYSGKIIKHSSCCLSYV